jgi:hypothetical protein
VCNDIVKAAQDDPDRHQPEYAYYPTSWFEPYLDRRRRCGFGLYATMGIARDDQAGTRTADAAQLQLLRRPGRACSSRWTGG